MSDKFKNLKVHFIGISGAGMSATAIMLKSLGAWVTGSDEGFYDPVASYLKKHNILVLTPHRKRNIPRDADLIIVGRHAKLDPKENEEVEAAIESKIPLKSFPELLGDITEEKENIVVAGSYGKSTSASLLAWCLTESGKDVGYFFGAIPIGFEESAHYGRDENFILEGDEYPAYGGKSKFLYLHTKELLLTSCEHDHVNVFPTIEEYLKPYKELVQLLPKDGLLVTAINNPNVKEVVENSPARLVTYGIENATWHAKSIKYGEITTFQLFKDNEKIAELSTSLLGIHNIENIVGVSAFLLEKNLISVENLKKSVASFRGLKRRLDLKTDKSTVLVYEGFGSSYTKAKTVFDALKLHFPNKRLITIFEPHTFSWRNKNNLHWYSDIFNTSTETLILKPAEHGQNTHDQATLQDILEEATKTNEKVYGLENKNQAFEILEKIVKSDDIIVLMSSGDLGGLINQIPLWAENKFPK